MSWAYILNTKKDSMNMNVALSLNKNYVDYATVLLYSLAVNQEEHVTAYLLHCELTAEDFKQMECNLKTLDIKLISLKVDTEWFDKKCPVNSRWPREAYFRLLLVDLLPASVDRILYLDVDTIVNQSLSELYYSDFSASMMLVTADFMELPYQEYLMKKQLEKFAPFLKQGFRYFNSGVLLMNIESMRIENHNFSFYCQVMKDDWNYEMVAPDQDLLNWIYADRVTYVPWERFDLLARMAHEHGITYEEVKEKTAVVHYTVEKPWESANYHFDIEKLWWDYAKMTPIYQILLENFLEKSIGNEL